MMDNVNMWIAFLSLIGTVVGSFSGILIANKLSNYRIEQLEKKLDKYADKQDEMSKVQAVQTRDLETAFVRIDELKELVRK